MIKIILLGVLGMVVCQPSLPGGWHTFRGHLGVDILLACKSKLESENYAVHNVIPMDPILEQVQYIHIFLSKYNILITSLWFFVIFVNTPFNTRCQ